VDLRQSRLRQWLTLQKGGVKMGDKKRTFAAQAGQLFAILSLLFLGVSVAHAAEPSEKPALLVVHGTDNAARQLSFANPKQVEISQAQLDALRLTVQPGNRIFEKCTDQMTANCFKSVVRPTKGGELIVTGITGLGSHRYQVSTNIPDLSKVDVAFACLSADETLALAIAATVALAALILLIAGYTHTAAPYGERMKMLTAFLLEPETNSYSLSKLQLYLWMSVTLFGYIYLALSRYFVQDSLEWVDVQKSGPSMLGAAGLAVGTTVLSSGIKSLAGGKGSGDFKPGWSDLITSGGVVAPERVQFLIWTIVAIVSYIGLTIGVSPDTIENLPTVPQGLLGLTAVSAGGYLGGQVARGPGPKLTGLVKNWKPGNPSLALDVNGSGLATKGSAFYIADITQPSSTEVPVPLPQTFDPGSVIDSSTGVATRLLFSVTQPAGIVWTSAHKYRFSIVNPDGERAAYEFNLP
jgi:hypothetical protein